MTPRDAKLESQRKKLWGGRTCQNVKSTPGKARRTSVTVDEPGRRGPSSNRQASSPTTYLSPQVGYRPPRSLHVSPGLRGRPAPSRGGTTVPHSQGSLCGFTCHPPVVWGEGSVGDQGPRVQDLVGKREGFLSRQGGPGWSPGGQSPRGGPGQWIRVLGQTRLFW